MTTKIQAIWKKIFAILQKCLIQIFAIHLAYIALGVILFAPLAGISGQFLLNFSGQSMLSDLDIAYFLLSPPGVVALILFASLTITILVFEQASLMALCCAALQEQNISFFELLLFTARRVRKIFLFAIRLVFRVLFLTLPFISLAIAIAWVMLNDYDINYYLSVRPPIFTIAACSIGLILLVMTTVLIRHLCSWSLALPLILFSDTSPAQCFDKSEALSLGNKQLLMMTFASWALGGTLLGTIILGAVQILGSTLAPYFFNSITLLVPVLGGLVALWALANLLVTSFTSSSFAALMILFYDRAQCEIPLELFTDTLPRNKKKIATPLFAFLLLAAVGIAILIGGWLINGIPADNDTMIIAHRGAAGKAPENTKVAMRHAINDGADWIEIDVQETIDGEVVVIHDSDFMKLANINLKIWEGRLEEIQDIDVGSWFNGGFSSERVPTLQDILAIAKGKCRVLIELKYYGHDIQLEQRVAEIVEQADMVEHIAIMSLKYKGINNFRRLRPDWPVGLLSSKAIGKISDLEVDFLAINMATAKPSFIRRIQSSGKKVYVWTVNDQASMSRLMTLGVDGIITDEPALANEVRNKIKNITPVERLLLHTAVLLKTPIPQHLYRDQSP